jgi:hypothetical protein
MPSMADEVAIFPDLSFWYGLSFADLCEMPNWALSLYAHSLNRLTAQQESMYARAALLPQLKKAGASRYTRQLARRQKDGLKERPRGKMSLDQIAGAAAASGIGFVKEPRT